MKDGCCYPGQAGKASFEAKRVVASAAVTEFPDGPYVVEVISAKGLPAADNYSDSGTFATFGVSGKEHAKTSPHFDCEEPLWQYTQPVKVEPHENLRFHIWTTSGWDHEGKSCKETLVGSVLLPWPLFARAGFNGELPIETPGSRKAAFLTVKVAHPDVGVPIPSFVRVLQLTPNRATQERI